MRRSLLILTVMLFAFNTYAADINTESLKLTPEQNQKLTEMKNNLKAEVQPIWEEIESSKQRIQEIEKKYFEEFWKMLTEEQRTEFSKLNQ